MHRVILFTTTIVIATTLSLAVGCAGPRNFENDNDKLRRTNLELQDQVNQMQAALKQRVAQIDALEQQLQQQTGIDPTIAPRLTRITFGRYSGTIDTNNDGRDDTLRIYVKTLDQDDHFYPARATAVLQAMVIPTPNNIIDSNNNAADNNADNAPRELFTHIYSAEQFAAAYRSGMTGTHFTFETPLPDSANLPDAITIQLSVTDRSTNITLTEQMHLRIKQ